ncbi:MAG: 4-alpha-glucanotransferase [Frankiaceae bacterium]|nr:4-alpha-glucanotransferase [Frankiaceae bacterium]
MTVLRELATAHGVACEYVDHAGGRVEVSDEVLSLVLGALGVDTTDPAAALAEAGLSRWRRTMPAVVATRVGRPAQVWVHCPDGAAVTATLGLEAGGSIELVQVSHWVQPQQVDGVLRGEATFELPPDLPPGYHRLTCTIDGAAAAASATVIVAPERLPDPPPAWGWAVQLYATPSESSWGHGDLEDLRTLVDRAGREHEAGFILVNPLSSPAPVPPIEPSPYYPSSRLFVSPLYLRIESTEEYADLPDEVRLRVDALRLSADIELVNRNVVWAAKKAALELIWPQVRFDPEARRSLAAFRAAEGPSLERFALWCALAERHGGDWRRWPEDLRSPSSPAVALAAKELAGRVAFHCWLQQLAQNQLARASEAARAVGMAIGVMHDLPVGVSPGGADAWALQDVLVLGATTGAPPDAFNQVGQDWQQPPWHPQRLAEAGYEPFVAIARGLLRHGGALRVDHVLGMFRLWWVPAGHPPSSGTYVRYDVDALLAVLALEASRAGAALVGEDLGVVPPEASAELADRGILGTTVLAFESLGDGVPRPPEEFRKGSLGAVVTHDMPPVAAWLSGMQVDLRERLGLLTRPVEEERAAAAKERDGWLALAHSRGLDTSSTEAACLALHELLAASPCRLRVAQLVDAVGDVQVQNQPGTTDEHPNWRLPLADGSGKQVLLDDALGSEAAMLIALALGYRSLP